MRAHSTGFVLEQHPFAEGNIEAEEWQADLWGPDRRKEHGKDGSPGLFGSNLGKQLFVRCLHSVGPGET